ncbi:MAG TPA: response regulator [Thermoanaerobaculia bacterium]|jgi:CheY-like chemotaxis protein|nr:response regulator [Thermoanaerobaculia bacterium]
MPKKILLADDSLTIQKVVELTFSDSGYELVCVSNGQKALDRIQQDRPDLVLADVVMPEKNGYEVCEAIKSNPATARIPVILLSGTFEPFDRERAERIGADAIVSKPFDSQQLIAQVDLLLDRGSPGHESLSSGATAPMPVAPVAQAPAEAEEAPFDVGFSAEDFTAAVRMPPRGVDPFEEEYGRGGVDSAIQEFEKSHPEPSLVDVEEPAPAHGEEPVSSGREERGREAPPPWLREEPEKAAEPEFAVPSAEDHLEGEAFGEGREISESTVAIPMPPSAPALLFAPPPAAEIPTETAASKPPVAEDTSASPAVPTHEGREELGEEAFEVHPEVEAPEFEHPAELGLEMSRRDEVSREIEVLAQKSSIPELTQMLSNVAKSGGNDWSDEQIEKLARRVVEKLSDRVVREIAWEVIPDMAEIVIKRRIKELEAGTE